MKKKILLGSTALALMLIGAMFFIPVSVFSTPVLYGTNVPAADSTDNNVSADVIGNKEDAAAAGAVSTTESLMAYAKQNVTNTQGQWITKSTVTSSEIPDGSGVDAQTAPIATVSTGGAWLSDIIVQTDATGLAAPTNIEISIDNSKGAYTDESEPICVEVIGSFGANVTFVKSDLDTDNLPVYVEAGKSVYIHGDDAGGTGAGTADVILKWEAAELAATITESDVSP